MTDRSELLPDARHGEIRAVRLHLHERGDVATAGSDSTAGSPAPGEKFPHGATVGARGVRIANGGGEEFKEPRPPWRRPTPPTPGAVG
jgi:hypothetical protein